MKTNLIFNNTEIAFALKSDSQLERAYFLFKMISIAPLVRIGAIVTNFAMKAHLPVEGLIRATVFDHFCGGIDENDCLFTVNRMYHKEVYSVLDYSVERKSNEQQFDEAKRAVMRTIEFAESNQAISIAVFKPSALGRFELYEKISCNELLSHQEQIEWQGIVKRYDTIFEKAQSCGISVLVDAEESWIQNAVDHLLFDMMKKYNIEKPIVFNTIQMYRKDRLDFIKLAYKKAKKNNFFMGIKLVRGAYMEKENQRANERGYTSPICDSKLVTDQNFNDGLHFIMKNLECMALFAGTHNEESSYLIMRLMCELGLVKNDPRIWFGQLYGMSDHITFNLSQNGYNVAKYVPFGPLKDVMPYLVRRAEENTSVAGQIGRELALLAEEKKRRKTIL